MGWEVVYFSAQVKETVFSMSRDLRKSWALKIGKAKKGRIIEMADLKDHIEELLAADPELRNLVEAEAPLRELQSKMILARQKAGLSQAEVARRMGTSRSTISRLESVNNDNWPTFDTIRDYAKAVGCKAEVIFVSEDEGSKTLLRP